MAIFPLQSNYVIDVDIITTTSFKAGMVLMRDDNGRAIPADNASLLYKTIQQKAGKILGYAASDHDAFGNTIIVPDVIGSSYLDENKNFVRFENTEVKVVKRAIPDLQDPNYNITNATDRSVVAKRGISVYNQMDEVYITDQFVRVLHGDFGQDFTDTIDFNPGDLLTVGSGVNAGKLVKVNVNSIGTDIIVVGVVEKYVSVTGLLHFSNAFYSVTFSSSSAVMAIDAGNSLSFTDPSSLLANDLTTYNNDGTLTNGVSYDITGNRAWVFDGTNDYIDILVSNMTLNNASFTALCWVYLSLPTKGTFFHLGNGSSGIAVGVGFNSLENNGTNFIMLYPLVRWVNNSYNMGVYNEGWNFVAVTSDASKNTTTYLNNNSGVDVGVNTTNLPSMNTVTLGRCNEAPTSRYLNGKLSEFRLYNRALSASEILAYYNATKSRFGL